MSDFSTLRLGLSGLEADHIGLDTVGQNVANANTPGYVDERANFVTVSALQRPGMNDSTVPSAGDGVTVPQVQRLSNSYLQSQVYTAQGDQGALTAQQSGLQQIQSQFSEPSSSNGISSLMTTFWQNWSTLASNPADTPTRATVIDQGTTLASALNQASSSLTAVNTSTLNDISATVTTVNTLAKQIAALNQNIGQGSAASGASSVSGLEDQRDQLVSQLSSQLGIRTVNNADGTVNVYSGNEPLVQGNNSQQLSASTSGPPYALTWSGDGSSYQPTSGALAGMLSTVNTSVLTAQKNLDQVAQSLMGSVNYLLGTGYDLYGNKGAPFFTGSGAADIAVNPAIVSDPSKMAVAASPGPGGTSTTATTNNQDGSIAALIGELPNQQSVTLQVPVGGWGSGSSQTTTTTGPEADVAYNDMITAIGSVTSSVNTQVSAQVAVATNATTALQSATGVNTDEELSNMVQFQNAYDASAKFISTVSSTLQTLINMVQ
jgi:flagellar hook-associated protein 1 FlgK